MPNMGLMYALSAGADSRKSRRVISGAALMSRSLRGAMDGGADALIGAAATDVGHRGVDIGVGGMRILREQRRGSHDLPRLAVAALRHVFLDPRALHGVRAVLGEAFDRGHPFGGDGGHGQYAGARRDAVQVDGAGAALGDAAAELGAGETEGVTQHPEERRVGGDVDRFALAVDGEADRGHEGGPHKGVGNNVHWRTAGWKGDPYRAATIRLRVCQKPVKHVWRGPRFLGPTELLRDRVDVSSG